jgi:hypothetical protein
MESFLQAVKDGKIITAMAILAETSISPGDNNNQALIIASENDDIDMLELLLKDDRTDPTVNNFAIYKNALRNKNEDIVELFLSDRRINIDEIVLDDSDSESETESESSDYNCTCGHNFNCDCGPDDCECGEDYTEDDY